MKRCIYCLATDRKFSLEHIWPDKLGGNLCRSLVTNDVCEKCNNVCGLFVDAQFIKSFFIITELGARKGTFSYLNRLNIPSVDGNVCDVWLSKGAVIFQWFPEDEKFVSYSGGNPIKTKRSRAYLYLDASVGSEEGNHLIHKFYMQFSKATCIAGNFQPDTSEFPKILHVDQAESYRLEQEAIYHYIRGKTNSSTLDIKGTLQLGFEERFMAKLSLGFGYIYLGNSFLDSDTAVNLREFLWKKDPVNRLKVDIKGSGFQLQTEEFDKFFWVKDCWTVGVIVAAQALWQLVVTPGGHSMTMLISDKPELWEHLGFDEHLDGRLAIINPLTREVRMNVRVMDLLLEYNESQRQKPE